MKTVNNIDKWNHEIINLENGNTIVTVIIVHIVVSHCFVSAIQ